MDKQDRAQAHPSKLSPQCFVAVHVGAGRHSRKTEQQYKDGDLRFPQMTSSCQRYKMSPTLCIRVHLSPFGLVQVLCSADTDFPKLHSDEGGLS